MQSKDGSWNDPRFEIIYLWDRFMEVYKGTDIEKSVQDLNEAFQDYFGKVIITIASLVEDKKSNSIAESVFKVDCFKCFGKPFRIGWALDSEESKKMFPQLAHKAIDVMVHEIDIKTGISKNKKHIITFMQAYQEESKYILEKLIYGKI
ncbi:MAG: hypothetical protein R3250_07960 [Melioribacteraceae bacterium]|nr:hypothetical protein [Melioribacteraceae bacterium]